MANMFNECNSLKSLNLDTFDTSHVSKMELMFNGCTSLESINLGTNFLTSNVNNMRYMFKNCNKLKSLNLNNFDTSQVTDMDSLFNGCTSLESINFGLNFLTPNVRNMAFMFNECRVLQSIDLSTFSSPQAIYMDSMFNGCTSLESINFGSNFDTSGVLNMRYMFNGCASLISLDLRSFDTSNVNNMESMFNGCTLLESLNLDNFNTEKVENMEKMFYECNSLYSLNLDSFDTSSVSKMGYMFYGCNTLRSLNLSHFNLDSTTNLINMFNNCNEDLIYCIKESMNEEFKAQLVPFENNCYEICQIKSLKFVSVNLQCIDSCANDENYRFEYNNRCYSSCPTATHNSPENNYFCEDIDFSSIIESFNHANSYTYFYEMNLRTNQIKNNYVNYVYIEISEEIINFIKSKFNLNEEADRIYIFISDYPSDDLNMATSDYEYKFVLEDGTELNLNTINEDIYVDIDVPITDLDLANFNYFKYFAEQGYDIYDKNSNFYNDVCSPAYLGENDMTLGDRRKDIYPNNVTLCKEKCTYKSVNIEEKRIVCSCPINENNNNNINDDDDFLELDDDNFLTYFLDYINYKIFKCYLLISVFDNLKQNYAFYAIIGIFLVTIILNLIFSFYSIPKLKISMIKNMPTFKKLKEDIIKELKRIKNLNKQQNNIPSSPKKRKKRKKENINIEAQNKRTITTTTKYRKQKGRKKKAINRKNSLDKNTQMNVVSMEDLMPTNLQLENNKEEEKEEIEDINELPFTQAIIHDKRNIFQIFKSIFISKLELIQLFIEDGNLKIIKLSEYILSLLINFFFNTLLYSDEVVSNKYHNNGKLDFIVTIAISLLSNIITSIICYFVQYSKGIEERLGYIMEIKNQKYYIININIFFKFLKVKIILFVISAIIVICGCFYYIVIFCIIYSCSKVSLIINYLSSLLEGFITSIIISVIVLVTRKIGLSCSNKNCYNTSKYINNKF